jgi:glycosyltransferase involved in cell wall biosynthesis
VQDIKVILLASYLGGGGAEKAMRYLNRAFKSSQIDSTYIAIERMASLEVQNDSEIVLSPSDSLSRPIRLLVAWGRLQKLLKKNPNSIVVANCDLAEIFVLFSFSCKKVIIVEHSSQSWSNRRSVGRIVRLLLYKRGVDFVSVSRSVSIQFLHKVNYKVIENVIEPLIFDDERKELEEGNRLVFIGRLSNEKNPSRFLDIVKSCRLPGLIIGSGPIESELIEKASKEEIDVTFMGYQAKPWSHVRKSDALIVTSLFEGKPLVILEALSIGIKVFSVDLPNLLNEFEMFGVDFCASDWDFAGRIEQWHLSKEPDLRSTVGKKTFDLKAHNSRALESWLNFFAAL